MKNRIIIAALCLFASGTLSAQSVYPGQHRGKIEKETVAPLQVKSFDLKDIRLLPSRFRENMMRDSAWMASIDVNRLLHSFRTNAGVFAGREGGYMTVKKLGGWESLDCELRGHTAGHLLSAYGLMYAATGSEIFKLKGDSIVNGLASVQEALGNGYLSAFPEELINRNIRGTGVWAPWYTLHKLFSGLIDQYLYADNEQALNMVKRMGDWADIWVCSRSGLYRIGEDLQVADYFTKENLLPDDQVMSILEDRQGNYWIATCEEVVKYTPSENKHCTYQMQNEIDDLDFNNAVVMFADSTVWWTNEGGLIYTSEKNISVTKKLAANPTITSCYVGDVEYDFPYMDQSRGIVLPESGNSIRFKFSNLDYSLPNANVYEYRLEGYDKDWIKQNGVNEVTYKDLPSGKYVFKLRVPDGDVMTEQQTVVVVRKSYSFLIGLFLVAVLIAILIVYFSSKIWKLKRRMTNERIILSTVKEQGKAKKTVLPEVKVNSLLDNLLSYMENEKPYLSAKLNISDVSMKLDCTEIELSQLLNNHLNVNFSNFINTYRVNEIKHRLNQDNLSKYTLKALSEQCGFSSKTTFYRVFKNVTGMTPLEYCKRENLVVAEI